MSHRLQQIESLLRRAIAIAVTQKLSDPRVEGMISVTRVQVSPDLRDAYVYLSVMPAAKAKTTLAGLRHAAPHVHRLVCQQVELKTVPHLDFRLDEGVKKEADVMAAIRRGVRREDARPAPAKENSTGSDADAADAPDNAPNDPPEDDQ